MLKTFINVTHSDLKRETLPDPADWVHLNRASAEKQQWSILKAAAVCSAGCVKKTFEEQKKFVCWTYFKLYIWHDCKLCGPRLKTERLQSGPGALPEEIGSAESVTSFKSQVCTSVSFELCLIFVQRNANEYKDMHVSLY